MLSRSPAVLFEIENPVHNSCKMFALGSTSTYVILFTDEIFNPKPDTDNVDLCDSDKEIEEFKR